MLPRAVLAPSVAVVPLKAESAESPTATLSSVVVFSLSASAPMAVLKPAVVLFLIAAAPIPVRCTAGGVLEEHSKTNGQVEAGVVVAERLRPNGHVKVASGVVLKRPRTNRHVILAGSIGSKRIETHGGIVDPAAGGIDTVQRVNSHCCVSNLRHTRLGSLVL